MNLEHPHHHSGKAGAFLLVIPGATLLGVGAGLLSGHVAPFTVMGLGAGMLLWGLIVVLHKR